MSDHLRNQLLGDALDAWESDDGPFTDAELDAASRVLGPRVLDPHVRDPRVRDRSASRQRRTG